MQGGRSFRLLPVWSVMNRLRCLLTLVQSQVGSDAADRRLIARCILRCMGWVWSRNISEPCLILIRGFLIHDVVERERLLNVGRCQVSGRLAR